MGDKWTSRENTDLLSTPGHLGTWLGEGEPGDLAPLGAETEWPTMPSRYTVDGWLGRGGMGVVLRVYDRELDRFVAMKVSAGEARSTLNLRFVREARLTAQMDHAGIVPIHDFGVLPNGRLYYTMKEVRGRTFREVIDEHSDIPWTGPAGTARLIELIEILRSVSEAVAHAHSLGVLHRDLKPENIVVGQLGEVMVIDWGLARIVGGQLEEPDDPDQGPSAGLTRAGVSAGTPGYMPGEQARGELSQIGTWSDVYALGATLFHLLIGRPPGESERPPSATLGTLPIPLELQRICDAAMEPEPARRPADAGVLVGLLTAWLRGARAEAQAGHLTEQADAVVNRLGERRSAVVRELLSRLISPDGLPVAAPAQALRGVDPDAAAVLSALIAAGVVHKDEAGSVALTNGELLQRWPLLRSWVEREGAEGRRTRQGLSAAASAWSESPTAGTWEAEQLARLDRWLLRTEPILSPSEAAFVGASRSELGRRRRVRQVLRTGLLLGLFGAAAGMAWLWMEARWAEQDTRVEAERARAAEAQAEAEARHASSNLAVAYEERAVSALADGDPAQAKLYAAATLELEERPAARGVLTDTHLWSPRLQRTTRIAQSCRFGILSPDSSTAACRTEDGPIVVDVDFGDLLLHRPPVAVVNPQSMTLDGDWFAAVEEGGRVNVYDIRTSALLRSLDVAAPRYTSVALSKAAGLVAYASTERRGLVTIADGREKVWDSPIPFMGSLSISTDGSRIFHSGKGAVVRLDKERVTHRFNQVDRWFGTMLVDEERGVLLTTSSPGTAYLLSVDDLDPIREWKAHDNLIWGLAFQPGLILTSAADGSIRAWDREEATELGRISAHLGSIWSLSIKDGVLHSLGDDGFLRSWTLAIDPRTAATMRGLRGAHAVWDRSGQVLMLEGPEGLRQISLDERGGSISLPIPGLLISAADPSGEGRFVVAAGRLTRLDDRGGAKAVDLGSIPFAFPNIKVSPDGSILVVVDKAVSRIYVRRSTDGQVVSDRKLETSDSTFGLDISPDGKFVAIGSYDRTVRLFSLPALEPIQRWEMSAEVSTVAFSPDGRTLATTLHDGGLRLLSLSAKDPDRGWTAHEGIASGLSWSPDGRWLATTGFSGGQRIWSVTTGALWAELPRLNQPVYHAAWSPDGATLATHAHDGSVRLFDMADLERPGSALRVEAEAETGLALVNGHLLPRP